MSEVRERVAKLPADTAIFYTGVNTVREGAFASAAEALPLVAETANRPIIIDAETFLGSGAVGGLVLSPDQIGRDAGHIVLRIFNGENPSDIPITTASMLKPIFDWRQLQRWNVSESRLPPDSEIQFRTPSEWEQYGRQIVAAIAALILQAALILWLFHERRRRRAAEAVTRQTMSDLMQVNRMATAGELSGAFG